MTLLRQILGHRRRRRPDIVTRPAVASTHRISPVEAHRLQQAGSPLLDVRTPDEFRAGHAEGSVNIPLGRLSGAAAELPDGAVVVTMCQAGGRSGRAVALLHGRGIRVVLRPLRQQ
jgi:rhodanese-related sulfurtransferase